MLELFGQPHLTHSPSFPHNPSHSLTPQAFFLLLCAVLQVSRFLAAASSSFEALPLSSLGLGLVLELFQLPQLTCTHPHMLLPVPLLLHLPQVSRFLAAASSSYQALHLSSLG